MGLGDPLPPPAPSFVRGVCAAPRPMVLAPEEGQWSCASADLDLLEPGVGEGLTVTGPERDTM